eukprot:4547495-Prymnesium_polylepis.1
MIYISRRGKGYFTHAVLAAIELRTIFYKDRGEERSRYEIASGKTAPLDNYRIFGATAYGTLVPEQRKQLRLDKADPRAVCGVYVGNDRERRVW